MSLRFQHSMSNVYFLFGNDEFAITRRLKEFEADFPDPTSADMNTARLEARTMTENDLNNGCQRHAVSSAETPGVVGRPFKQI